MITHRISSQGFGVEDPSPEAVREAIEDLEDTLRTLPQVEVTVDHQFAFGTYTRTILIPKGCALTGRVHKQCDMNIVAYGDITIRTENGMKRVTGPAQFPGAAGVKQAGFAHEDTLWSTVHHTHLTDLREIEKELFADDPPVADFITGKPAQEVLPCRP